MTGATAYDLCEMARRRERLFNRGVTSSTDPAVQASIRRELAAERAMAEWAAHPALTGRIVPRDGRFVLILWDGRQVESWPTLRAAEVGALTWGVRVLDVTACGTFAPSVR